MTLSINDRSDNAHDIFRIHPIRLSTVNEIISKANKIAIPMIILLGAANMPNVSGSSYILPACFLACSPLLELPLHYLICVPMCTGLGELGVAISMLA